jgi:hypothetical protein
MVLQGVPEAMRGRRVTGLPTAEPLEGATMKNENGKIDKNARIVIVGAGPAGLSTAWFLSKNGFHNVTVLEKLGRVGGLCKSLTVDGLSYDLGANYVTWAYQETLKIAKDVGAHTYPEKPYISLELSENATTFKYRPFSEAILYDPYTKEKVSIFSFIIAAIRYSAIRWKLRYVIDIPEYLSRIHNHPTLCISFKAWLEQHKLMPLSTLFQFPITIMGYGILADIATPYALRYMSLRTFFPMVFGRIPVVKWIVGTWPKRFTLGFQRLWECVAWRTDVRLNVNITNIERSAEHIKIDFEYPEQDLNEITIVNDTQYYDYLVLACPLTPDVFHRLGLAPNAAEQKISRGIQINPYCMTTFWINNMDMPQPIAPILPIPEQGVPWAVARQFQDRGNMFTQFYTRPTNDQTDEEVIDEVRKLTALLGGEINESQDRWHTFDKFTYFQHFTPEQIQAGIYADLANMQGRENTFYVGGATDFELVEPIVKHSKHIVEQHFVGRQI